MFDDRSAIQLQMRRLFRLKWLVLGVTYVLVALMVAMNHVSRFRAETSLWKGAVNLFVGWGITTVMVSVAYNHARGLLEQLYQMAVEREEVERQLYVQHAALEAAANAIVITDKDGRITWVNHAFTELTGHTLEEAANQTPRLLQSGEHGVSFYTNLWETILSGQVWHGDIKNRRKDGSLYAEEQTITPVLDEDGQISGFIAIKQDISERKRLEKIERDRHQWAEALRETGLALNASLDLDVVLDRFLEQIGRVVPYDSANLMIIENDKAYVARKIGYDRISPEVDRALADMQFDLAETASLQKIISSKKSLIIPTVIDYPGWIPRDSVSYVQSWAGVPIVVQNEVVALFSLDKKEPGFYCAEHGHLLETFAVQAALAWQNAHLFEETRRRARELDLLNHIIGETAVASNVTQLLQTGCTELSRFFEVDQTVAVMFNEARTAVILIAEKLASDLPSLLGTAIPVVGNPILQRFFETGGPLVIPRASVLPLPPQMAAVLTQRGIESVLMVPILVREQVVGAVGIHSRAPRNFTETEIKLVQTVGEELGRSIDMIRLNEQLRSHNAQLEERVAVRTKELADANMRLQELDRLKSKFVSDVSHELRTPITNLGMYLDLLEHGRADKKERYIAILQRETARISQLVQDILDLSRLEESQEKGVAFEPVDLNKIVEQVVAAQLPKAQTAGLLLTMETEEDMSLILGAPRQLAQVATNLLANAINYTREGEITISTYKQNGEICLQVQDTGIGIDEADMPHLFDRFYRGQRVAQLGVPGTGLGLGIVKEIIDLHGGRVEASSEVGSGSTFSVWLSAMTEAA